MALGFYHRKLLIIDYSLHTDVEIHSQGLQEGILETSTRGDPSIKSSLAKAASNETERVVVPKEDTHLSWGKRTGQRLRSAYFHLNCPE